MSEERRKDPEDGKAYTFGDMKAFYKNKYDAKTIKMYWDEFCTPVTSSKGKKGGGKGRQQKEEEPEPKAKAKGKAKAKSKGQAKKDGADGKAGRERKRGGASRPANPKRFINEEAAIVQDCIDGLIWTTPDLGRVDAYPDIKVVFRTDWQKDKVALVSGGGAGHEPMHGGFVGRGMLTAAVSGETFASPTIEAVLEAIVRVTGPSGCLLIIKNYTGDRLNFTSAAQKARSMYGLKVEIVITKDDVATSAQRGVAGSLFVHKVAGALAEEGKSLEEVKAIAEEVIASSASMGVSLSSVRRIKPEMIKPKKMEVGLGIHGEPGAREEDLLPAAGVVDIIMEGVMANERMTGDAPEGYACLINNLGSVPPQEMCILAAALMKSKWAEQIKLLVGPAGLCTSLDMNGASLSLLRLSPEVARCLKAETSVAAWPRAVAPSFPTPVEGLAVVDPMAGVTASSDADVLARLERICKGLVDAKALLDELDGKTGDADCGSTMAGAATKVLAEKDALPLADAGATCRCLSYMLGRAMGGSSGVLLSIMFMGMATCFEQEKEEARRTWAEAGAKAFMEGLKAMMEAGGAKVGSRTMLDALVPAAEALLAGKSLAEAKEAAEAGAEGTKALRPAAGRAENVPEKAWSSAVDPGAKAAAIVFAALAADAEAPAEEKPAADAEAAAAEEKPAADAEAPAEEKP